MFNLTYEERRVILFLGIIALIGLGISYAVKINPAAEKIIKVNPDSKITKLDINRFSRGDLHNLRRISPKLGQKIIEYRNSHGPYENLEQLKEIKGIGDYRYEKLKELFYIEK